MWGIIKKDLFVIKGNSKIFLVFIISFLTMELQGNNSFTTILPVMSLMLFLSTFSYDAYNKWDAYACTLPDGRKNIVKSKYIATIIIVLCVAIFSVMLSYGLSVLTNGFKIAERPFNLEESISGAVGSIMAALLIVMLTYPLVFKFGIENGRIMIFVILGLVTALVGAIFKIIGDIKNIDTVMQLIEKYIAIGAPIIFIILLFISYRISEKIYCKKEF